VTKKKGAPKKGNNLSKIILERIDSIRKREDWIKERSQLEEKVQQLEAELKKTKLTKEEENNKSKRRK